MEHTRDKGGKILSFGVQNMAMSFSAVAQVDAYWEGLRKGRLMPARAEVDPRGLEQALEYAMMLEVVAPGVARIRVSGNHLSDLMGMEVRGMPLTVFIEPAGRTKMMDVIDRVVQCPQVADIKLSNSGGVGRPAMTARLLLAPLSGNEQGNPRILACLQSKGSIGRVPRRFGINDVHTRRIVASAVETTQIPIPRKPVPNPEFAEAAARFDPAPKPTSRRSERPYLRLVKSD